MSGRLAAHAGVIADLGVSVRSRVQKISPQRAAEMLAANTANRPLSRSTVRAFAEAMRRGDWLVTHQGIALDTRGVLVDVTIADRVMAHGVIAAARSFTWPSLRATA